MLEVLLLLSFLNTSDVVSGGNSMCLFHSPICSELLLV
jgi:hypothetical protein